SCEKSYLLNSIIPEIIFLTFFGNFSSNITASFVFRSVLTPFPFSYRHFVTTCEKTAAVKLKLVTPFGLSKRYNFPLFRFSVRASRWGFETNHAGNAGRHWDRVFYVCGGSSHQQRRFRASTTS